ncbi:hypothetical protein MSAN_02281600 [Mycena sanguinolenta]|uniref:Protein kinase domain-containing protein n=1 Tax=Mycena sanguinolenta TaxID=230812 RepID=A0A8H6X9S3_9AGAR|nr:hypothetical protein MSAN_02281600 [Mycena sanguinolenta]
MDLHPDSDPEIIVLSTSDAKSTPYPGVVSPEASRRARKAKPFIKSFSFLPSPPERELQNLRDKENPHSEILGNKTWQASYRAHSTTFDQSAQAALEALGERALARAAMEVLAKVLRYISANPRLGNHLVYLEFQIIRLGDIKLIKEFKEMRSSVVGRQMPGASVRRVYMAKIQGRESGHMTVAMYEGDGAEKAWNQHLANYESIRHPNILQLYGLVSSKGLYAMVFHDELIPYRQFRRRFEHLPVLSTYAMAYCTIIETTEYTEAVNYISNVFPKSSIVEDCKSQIWIRPRTGELCLDLVPGGPETTARLALWSRIHVSRLENVTLDAPDSEEIIISSLSEDQYHKACSRFPVAKLRSFQVSTEHPVGPGIFRSDSQYGTWVRITEPLVIPEEELHWDNYTGGVPGELLPDSWIRCDSGQACTFEVRLQLLFWQYEIQEAWLAQANRMFTELEKNVHVEDYVCAGDIQFILRCSPNKRHINPEGYLFVCPAQDLRTGNEAHANLYQWPACPAYWSLDPSGADCLSTEDAKILGFPTIHIETNVKGCSWDRNVYRGLRRFHEGKGHNPESREVARRLGYPLYEVLSDRVLFAARKVKPYSWCKLDPELC